MIAAMGKERDVLCHLHCHVLGPHQATFEHRKTCGHEENKEACHAEQQGGHDIRANLVKARRGVLRQRQCWQRGKARTQQE